VDFRVKSQCMYFQKLLCRISGEIPSHLSSPTPNNHRLDTLCILMEYCDSGDLYTYLQKTRKNNPISTAKDEPMIIEWWGKAVNIIMSIFDFITYYNTEE
jgi:hypothetical protein